MERQGVLGVHVSVNTVQQQEFYDVEAHACDEEDGSFLSRP